MLALLCIWNGDATIGVFLSACAIHELGHLLCMHAFGRRLALVSMSAVGIRMKPRFAGMLPVWRESAVLLAGPACNLLAGLFLCVWNRRAAGAMHLVLCIWNLLPYRGLDGGALWELWLSDRLTMAHPHWILPLQRMAAVLATAGLAVTCILGGIGNPAVYAVLLLLLIGEIL